MADPTRLIHKKPKEARYGEIPGFPVGTRWEDRECLYQDGVHIVLQGGIHGLEQQGACSIVLSGGYEDDVDNGEEFTYTGQGGQRPRNDPDRSQIKDQEWKRGNLALHTSYLLKKPVRVIRGSRLRNSNFAPAEGYRYDGLYIVVKAEMKTGKSGHQVCLFRFVRCPGQLPLQGSHATLPMRRKEIKLRSSESPHPLASSRGQSTGSSTGGDLTRPLFEQGSSSRKRRRISSPKPLLRLPAWPPPQTEYADLKVLYDPSVDSATFSCLHQMYPHVKPPLDYSDLIEHVRKHGGSSRGYIITGKGEGKEVLRRVDGSVVGRGEEEVVVRDPRQEKLIKRLPARLEFIKLQYEYDINSTGPPPTSILITSISRQTPARALRQHFEQYGTLLKFEPHIKQAISSMFLSLTYFTHDEARRCVEKEHERLGRNVPVVGVKEVEEWKVLFDPEGAMLKVLLKELEERTKKGINGISEAQVVSSAGGMRVAGENPAPRKGGQAQSRGRHPHGQRAVPVSVQVSLPPHSSIKVEDIGELEQQGNMLHPSPDFFTPISTVDSQEHASDRDMEHSNLNDVDDDDDMYL